MLDPQEEAKFVELKATCRELRVQAPTDLFIGTQVHDAGKLIHEDIQRGHSWTRNYWNYLHCLCSGCTFIDSTFGAGYVSVKRLVGDLTFQASISTSWNSLLTAIANKYAAGIVVGTGTTAFNIDQYALATLIESGSSAAKLYYNASAVASTTYAPIAKTWTITGNRIFNNNSGGDIVVAETGLLVSGIFGEGAGESWLLERSKLVATVTVPDGAQLTVTYTIVEDFSGVN